MTRDDPLREYLFRLREAVLAGKFVKANLGKPTATAGDITSIDIRPILVKRVLKLSFTTHHARQDIVKNHTLEEAVALIELQLREHFRASYMATTSGDLQLNHRADGYHLARHAASITQAPELSHNREKNRAIDPRGKPYLHALNITDAKGEVYKAAQDKFRQINKYIEVLEGLLGNLPAAKRLRIVDMGAGKGYLTFALYDYLTHTLKRDVEMVGVEFRAELVNQCNDIADAAGFSGLRFVEGSIEAYDCANADMVIALHACDTATDDAIAKAIHAQASLIVVAPCCHKQIRRAMSKLKPEHPLASMVSHGTYAERMAEMITDTLRAEFMNARGYHTKLFEFISDAHTPKNVIIIGERQKKPDPKVCTAAAARIAQLKAEFGIKEHALESRL